MNEQNKEWEETTAGGEETLIVQSCICNHICPIHNRSLESELLAQKETFKHLLLSHSAHIPKGTLAELIKQLG